MAEESESSEETGKGGKLLRLKLSLKVLTSSLEAPAAEIKAEYFFAILSS